MNRNFKFLLPRVAIVTLLIGAAAVALFVIFKLLLAILTVAIVFAIAKKIIGRTARPHSLRNADYHNRDIQPYTSQSPIVPVGQQAKPFIIPVH